MSSKKIVRLKTPIKSRQQAKLSDSTMLSGIEFDQESTIMLVKNVNCSEELQVALINEINKLYKQIAKFKQNAEQDGLRKEQSVKENKILKNKLQVLEREYKMYKQMYQLERDNHDRLRKFYEAREKEWINIVNEHKKILEEYDQKKSNSVSEIEIKSQYSQLQSMYTTLEEMLSRSIDRQPTVYRQPHFGGERKEKRRLRSSIDREDSLSQPKFKLKLNTHKDTSFIELSHREERKERTPLKLRPETQTIKLARLQSPSLKNAQADDLFDSIVRKTYYKYKQKSIAVGQIEQLQDMVKLKNAKTSTKERLAKTIRKLDFQVSNQHELKVLCQCVQRAVIDKYKVLRGDYAFDLLIDKLKECEKLALSSNSELERLDKQKSHLTNPESSLKAKCVYNDASILLKDESNIYRGQKSIELLLDSTIKDERNNEKLTKTIGEEDLSQKIKFSGLNIRRSASEVYEPSGLGVQSKYVNMKCNGSTIKEQRSGC